jgi:two-component system NtrC family sensor kinase
VNVTDAVAEAPHQIVADLQRRLDEALAQQAATADVLKIISRSSFDLQTVLETLITSAVRLCGANRGSIFLREGEVFPLRAASGTTPGFLQFWAANPCKAGRGSATARVIASGKIEVIADVLADPEMEMPPDSLKNIRAALGVPMLRDDRVEGVMVLTRPESGPFSQSQIGLVQTFADQAVIAIENTRLIHEIRQALERQSATADILKVIASSPSDVHPVFDAIAARANRLLGGFSSTVMLFIADALHLVAFTRTNAAADQTLEASFPRPIAEFPPFELVRGGETVEFPDTEAENVPPVNRELARMRGYRSMVFVPLMSNREPVGILSVTRVRPGTFPAHDAELLRTFADQAVIAIENARLLNELRRRTQDLGRSLENLRSAQDRLVQTEKLASLGQLTAGIAHEIKNPLNFVNNFAALSAELTDELDEALLPAPLDQKMRGEVGELTHMLKSNLEKVVQHGKRADSIVKNMLLHSRESSGERRESDLNALVRESLNLAYHGARAERSDFNISLEQDLDPDAGVIEVYPQELTRALLNLISNGFYAAVRRKMESHDETFEPVLIAATKNAGNVVEIRIRDNGTGIAAEVREKMFNPFFTTKPTGEGTGLGLSMAHDIVVKQHGGRIDVQTEPGSFTEFIITLPRVNGSTSSRQPE